jgi:flagellar hook-associated protein 2
VAVGSDNAARGLAVEILNLTAGSYSGTVQLKSGKPKNCTRKSKN